LGAAMLAGLAVGIYKNTSDLSKVWKASQSFKPTMNVSDREEKLKHWSMAISAVTHYRINNDQR